ncbi:MAG: hypothetical protein U9N56_10885 [Actinomycetota bacterium]|nr:hypothetical protein [Actinomycetota bacterium]
MTGLSPSPSHPLESVLGLGLKRLLQIGLPLTAVALVMPAPASDDGLLVYFLVHLTILQFATFAYAAETSRLLSHPWFPRIERSWLASSVSVIAATVGFSALLTLATSAAARYDISLQFLQLLSSMDIAWVVAAIYLGGARLWGRGVGLMLGTVLLAACVASIAVYLTVVGFTDQGGWLIDGEQMTRIVISSDTVAAVASISILLGAGRKD